MQGIRRFGGKRFHLETVTIDPVLPPLLDDTDPYLPATLDADLVLDYMLHPDLSHDLAERCVSLGIPLIAPGKKLRIRGVLTPPICCALSGAAGIGPYGERFGAPLLEAETENGRIARIHVLRGAPCGATWEAARRIEGLPLSEAPARIGLETQFFCTADPAGWDPIYGKSPVHFAGHLHQAALEKALGPGRTV